MAENTRQPRCSSLRIIPWRQAGCYDRQRPDGGWRTPPPPTRLWIPDVKPTAAFWIAAVVSLALPAAGRPDSVWLDSVDEAITEALRSDRLILVDLWADWCGWCKRLDAEVFSHPEFRSFAEDFVLLRVDTEDRGEGTRLHERFGVSVLPTMLILDGRMTKVGAVRGFTRVGGYIAKIEDEIEAYRELEESFANVRGSSDPMLLTTLAHEFHERHDVDRAVELYERLLDLPPRDAKQERWTRYRLVQALRLGRRFDRASEELGRMRLMAEADRDSLLVEQLDLLEAEMARERGDCKTAVAVLKSLLRRNPRSDFREEASSTLRSLEAESPECT